MLKFAWIIGALFGMFAVILGAMGAHALKEVLHPAQLLSFETAVRYQFFHGLVLLIVFLAKDQLPVRFLNIATALITLGVVFFSGSIYLLSCKDLIGLVTYKWLGPITPIGGVLMILGWLFLIISGAKKNFYK